MKKHPHIFVFLLISALFSACGPVFASFDDGFDTARSYDSRYFTIYVEQGVSLTDVTMAISVPPSIKAVIRQPIDSMDEFSLPNQLDILYLAVSEILDIHLSKFKCKLKICKNGERLKEVASKLFGMDIPKTAGFFVAQLETLYIDAEEISINVLGHELAHAIQTSYFVVPPPVTIQEVLSGYVEFQFRKYTKTLPKKNEVQI